MTVVFVVSSMGVGELLSSVAAAYWQRPVAKIIERYIDRLPSWLVRAGVPSRNIKSIHVSTLPLDDATKKTLLDAAKPHKPIEISLDQSVFLTKRITLPRMKLASAEAAIAVQLRQTMPAQADGLVWRTNLARQRRKELEFDVFVLKSEQLTKLLRDVPAPLRKVVIANAIHVEPLVDNRRAVDRPERFWLWATGALCALAICGTLAIQTWQIANLRAEERSVALEVAELRSRGIEARAAYDERVAVSKAGLNDRAVLRADRGRLSQLADLTNALDDTVWLTSAAFSGETVKLSGFANGGVSNAVAAIRTLPWVLAVDTDGSITVDPVTGEERFQMTIERRQEALQ